MDNQSLFFWIYNLSHKSYLLDSLMIFTTDYVIYLTILFIFILGVIGRLEDKKALLITILAMPISILLIKIIHLFIYEPRPFVTLHFTPLIEQISDASFPSRHATIISVIAWAFAYFKSRFAFVLLFIMLLVGFSRIYLGVHYPLDILGGFIAGILSLILALQLKKLIKIYLFG